MAWTHPITWAAARLVSVSDMNTYHRDNMKDLYTIVARQTSDLTKNANTTLANLVGMTFAVTSGEIWVFQAWSFFFTLAVADAKWTVTAPATSTGRFGFSGAGLPLTNGSESTFGNPIAMTCTAVNNTAVIAGEVTAGATGSMQLQAAQNTSDASNSVWYTNSFLIAHRMS